jgi:hypothetical protein
VFKPLKFPSHLHPYPPNFVEYLPWFTREDHVSAEKHLGAFANFVDNLEIIHEDVVMRLFSKSLTGEVALWFRDLEPGSIGSWTDFYYVFSKYWDENKSLDQYLADFYTLRRGEGEVLPIFNRRFYNVYHSMPIEIHPTEVASMVQYTMAQHPNLFLYLRERKSPSLQQMFVDAEEVESNLRACAQLSCQILDNVLDEEETEEVYGQQEAYPSLQLFQHACTSFSDLKYFSDLEIIKSYFSIVKDANVHAYNSYQQDEFTYAAEPFPNYEKRDDFIYDEYHEEDFVEGGDISVLEKVVAPHHLTVDLENQLTFLAHDNLLDYILLNFGQEVRKELQEHVSLFSFSSIDGQQGESQQANKKEHIFVSTCTNSPSIDFVSNNFRANFSEDSKEEVDKSYGQSTMFFSSDKFDQQFQEDTTNKFLSQGDNQQPEKSFIVHDCFEACDNYGMFQGGQENYNLVSRVEIMKEHPSLLMQP